MADSSVRSFRGISAGAMFSGVISLAINTDFYVDVPDNALKVRIVSTAKAYYCMGEAAVIPSPDSSSPLDLANLSKGNSLPANTPIERELVSGTGRRIYFKCATTSTVDIDFFA